MSKEKVTLREIIRGMERISGNTAVGNLVLKDLKRLEKRIEGMPGKVKEMCRHKTAFFLLYY